MATTLPPARKTMLSEAEIEAVINKGGRPVKEVSLSASDKPKHINIRLTQGIVNQIDVIREKWPKKPGSPKLGISMHDWIVEAVLEKLEKDEKGKK